MFIISIITLTSHIWLLHSATHRKQQNLLVQGNVCQQRQTARSGVFTDGVENRFGLFKRNLLQICSESWNVIVCIIIVRIIVIAISALSITAAVVMISVLITALDVLRVVIAAAAFTIFSSIFISNCGVTSIVIITILITAAAVSVGCCWGGYPKQKKRTI